MIIQPVALAALAAAWPPLWRNFQLWSEPQRRLVNRFWIFLVQTTLDFSNSSSRGIVFVPYCPTKNVHGPYIFCDTRGKMLSRRRKFQWAVDLAWFSSKDIMHSRALSKMLWAEVAPLASCQPIDFCSKKAIRPWSPAALSSHRADRFLEQNHVAAGDANGAASVHSVLESAQLCVISCKTMLNRQLSSSPY